MKIIDLTLTISPEMPIFPSPYLPKVRLDPLARHEKEARSTSLLTIGTHIGTHIDAPFHAIPHGKTVEQISLDNLVGPVYFLRIFGKSRNQPISAQDLQSVPKNTQKLLLDTGWMKATWGTKEYFSEGAYLTDDAVDFILEMPNLQMIAMDIPNIDRFEDIVVGTPAPKHRKILGREILLVENLCNVDQLHQNKKYSITVCPLPLKGSDGSPCRVFVQET